MNCWKAESRSKGISVSGTWLGELTQLLKQNPQMNHLGHILLLPFQSTRSVTPLCAKWVAQASPGSSWHEAGGESFFTFADSQFAFFFD